MNETYTTVIGNLIGAVNHRQLADGTSMASFRVASNQRRWNRASGEWVDGDTLYVSVTCWRRLAENVAASFVPNDPVIVHGRLYSRGYEKDGMKRWSTEMEGLAVGPDLARCTAAVRRTPRPGGDVTAAPIVDAAADPGVVSAAGRGLPAVGERLVVAVPAQAGVGT